MTDPTADEQTATAELPDRIATIPNLLSFLRLLGVPLFLWLVLGPRADVWALIVLGTSAVTDYLDGKIARATGQTSRLGAVLDPFADRLYIASAVVALAIRDIIPWWLVFALVLRDLYLAGQLAVLRRIGYGPLPVHFLGKVATFCLLYALPLLFLGDGEGTVRLVAKEIGWAFGWWGVGAYWWAALLYAVQFVRLLRVHRRGGAAAEAP